MKQKELTVIQKIIYYSKCILQLRIAILLEIRKIETLAKIPIPFYSNTKNQKENIEEMEDRIKQYEAKIKLLLYPLFQGINFGYEENDKYWHLTVNDLQRGYLLLERVEPDLNKSPDKYIIPLSTYKDNRVEIKEGSLTPFVKVATVLNNFKDMQGNTPKIKSYLDNQIEGVELIPRIRRLRIGNQNSNHGKYKQ
jgi:hypothetical protein